MLALQTSKSQMGTLVYVRRWPTAAEKERELRDT